MLLEYWGIVIYSSHYEAKLKYCWKQQSTIYDGSESAGQQQDGFSNTSDVSLAGHVAKNKYIKLILKRFIIVCLSVWVAPEEKKNWNSEKAPYSQGCLHKCSSFAKIVALTFLCTCVRFQMVTLCYMFLRWLSASDLSKMLLWWRCLGIYECVYSSCMSKRWTDRNSHSNPSLYSSGRTETPLGSWAQANLHLELQKENSAVLGAGMDRFYSLHCKLK